MSKLIRFAFFALLPLAACTTTDQQVERLIEQLAANPIGSDAWQQAVDELVAIGRPAARQLIAHLNPDHYKGEYYREYRAEREKIRTGAARALGRIKPRGATAALKDRIGSAYTEAERIACMWAIGEIGFDQAGFDALKGQLEDEDPLIRLHAAIGIVKMDESDGVEEIEAALSGEDDELAQVALTGLEESNYFGVPLLVELAARPGPHQDRIRETEDRVRKNLVALLRSEDPVVRRRSARALGRLGGQEARTALLSVLDDPNNLVRFNAAAALADMNDPQGIEFLFDALQNDDPILRSNAVRFLIQVQKHSSVVEQRLIEALRSENPLVRSGASQVLGQARVSRAIQPLLAASEDPVVDVRVNAIIALGEIGAPESRRRLEALKDDPDPTVVYYARWALERLGQS